MVSAGWGFGEHAFPGPQRALCLPHQEHGKRVLDELLKGELPGHLRAWPEEAAGETLLVGLADFSLQRRGQPCLKRRG